VQCGGEPASNVAAPVAGSADAVVPPSNALLFAADPRVPEDKQVTVPTSAQLGPALQVPCAAGNTSDVNDNTLWYVTIYNGFGAPVAIAIDGKDADGKPKRVSTEVDNQQTWLSMANPVLVQGKSVSLQIDSVQYTINIGPSVVRVAGTVGWVQTYARNMNTVLLQMVIYSFYPALYFMAERFITGLQGTVTTCLPMVNAVSPSDVQYKGNGVFASMYNYTGAAVPYKVGLYDASVANADSASAYVFMETATIQGTFTIGGKAVTATVDMTKISGSTVGTAVLDGGVAVAWTKDENKGAGVTWNVTFAVYGDDRAAKYINLVKQFGLLRPRAHIPTVTKAFTLSVMSYASNDDLDVAFTPPQVSINNGTSSPGHHIFGRSLTRNVPYHSDAFIVMDTSAVPFTLQVGEAVFKNTIDPCSVGTTVAALTPESGSNPNVCVYLAVNTTNAVLVVMPRRTNPQALCKSTPNDLTCAWFNSIPSDADTAIPVPPPATPYNVALSVTCAWTVPRCGTPVKAPSEKVSVSCEAFKGGTMDVPWDTGVNAATAAPAQLLQGAATTVTATVPSTGNTLSITFAPSTSDRQAFKNDDNTMVVTLTDKLMHVFVLGGTGAANGTLASDLFTAASTVPNGDVGLAQLSVTAYNNTTSQSLTAAVFGCASQSMTADGTRFAATAVIGAAVGAAVQGSLTPNLVCTPAPSGLAASDPPPLPQLSGTLSAAPTSTVQDSAALLLPGSVPARSKPGTTFALTEQGYLVIRQTADAAAATAKAWNASPGPPALPTPVPPTMQVTLSAYNVHGALLSLNAYSGTDTTPAASLTNVDYTGKHTTFTQDVAQCVRLEVARTTMTIWRADLRTASQYKVQVTGATCAVTWPREGHAAVVLLEAQNDAAAAAYKTAVDAAWTTGADDPPTPAAPPPANVKLHLYNVHGDVHTIAAAVNAGSPVLIDAPSGTTPTVQTLVAPVAMQGTVTLHSAVNAGVVDYVASLSDTAASTTGMPDGRTVCVTWPRRDHEAVLMYNARTAEAAAVYAASVAKQWAAGAADVPLPSIAPSGGGSGGGGGGAQQTLATWKQAGVYGACAVAGAIGMGFLLGGTTRLLRTPR